jgi:hypothetical protein
MRDYPKDFYKSTKPSRVVLVFGDLKNFAIQKIHAIMGEIGRFQ